jgi:hypothetical protein
MVFAQSSNKTCLSVPSSIDLWLLENTWYVQYGLNPEYDCFKCQTVSIEQGTVNMVYSSIAQNGTLIWNDNKMRGNYSDKIVVRGRDNGFDNAVTMSVVLLLDDTLVIYYCGLIIKTGVVYDGVLVLSTGVQMARARELEV